MHIKIFSQKENPYEFEEKDTLYSKLGAASLFTVMGIYFRML